MSRHPYPGVPIQVPTCIQVLTSAYPYIHVQESISRHPRRGIHVRLSISKDPRPNIHIQAPLCCPSNPIQVSTARHPRPNIHIQTSISRQPRLDRLRDFTCNTIKNVEHSAAILLLILCHSSWFLYENADAVITDGAEIRWLRCGSEGTPSVVP